MNELSWKMKSRILSYVFRSPHKAWVPVCTRVKSLWTGLCSGWVRTDPAPPLPARTTIPGGRGREAGGDGDGWGRPAGPLPSSVPRLRADMARAAAAVAGSSTPSPSCFPPAPRRRRVRPAPLPLGAGPRTSVPRYLGASVRPPHAHLRGDPTAALLYYSPKCGTRVLAPEIMPPKPVLKCLSCQMH